MRVTLAAAFAFLLPLAAEASPAGDLAARIVDVLRRDDLSHLAQLADHGQADGRAWEELRDVLDRHDCVRIDRYDWLVVSESEDRLALRLRLEGTAALKAAWKPERHLRRWWNIEAHYSEGAWRLWRAETDERRIAMAMATASSIAEADVIADSARDVNPLDVIALYAVELERGTDVNRIEHALSRAREAADLASEITVLRSYALILLRIDPVRALDTTHHAVELARKAGSRDELARALLVHGNSQLTNGHHEAARETYAEGAALAEVVDDPLLALKCLRMFIHASWRSRGVREILQASEALHELSRRFEWEEGQQVALFDLADIQQRLGNRDYARNHYQTLLSLAKRHGNRRFALFAMHNLAALDFASERFHQSIASLEAILALSPEEMVKSEVLELLARAQIQVGRFDEAEMTLAHAENSSTNLQPRAAIFAIRSKLYLQRGEMEKAVESARDALRRSERSSEGGTPRAQAFFRGTLARALRAAGRNDEALAEFRTAVQMVESVQKQMGIDALGLTAFLQSYADLYVALVELLVARGDFDEAFQVAEQMKGRGLRELIADSRIDVSAALSPEERSRETAFETRVRTINLALLAARQAQAPAAELERQLAAARADLDAFRSEVNIKHPAVGRRRIDAAPVSAMPPGEESVALIEYVVAAEQVIAFVVTRESPIHAVRIPVARQKLAQDVRELENLVAARSPEYRQMAKRLYTTLLAPVERYVADVAALAIVPDGVLWTVPFHALIMNDGRHLVDRHPVFYAHSLHLLRQASTLRKTAPSRLFALGNPAIGSETRSTVRTAFRGAPLTSLLDAEVEVRSVSSMYPSERKRVYYRHAATESAFKSEAPTFSVIHIAAHAIVDDRAPLYSAIVLANGSGKQEDGLLEAREVVDLPLSADLAVLSACETARGKVGSGEGVIGLSWAFFAAGCPTTVVSQWRAESAATAELMIEFHRRLRAGDTTAEAVRHAQMKVRRSAKYRHPFYWAPFIAVGAANQRSKEISPSQPHP